VPQTPEPSSTKPNPKTLDPGGARAAGLAGHARARACAVHVHLQAALHWWRGAAP